MNCKMLFIAPLSLFLSCSAWLENKPFSHSFSVEESADRVTITLDTFKKLTLDDIHITHKHNKAQVDITSLGYTFKLGMQADRDSLTISLFTEKRSSKEDDNKSPDHEVRAYEAFHGVSSMSRLIPTQVNLEELQAEYSGTQLILSVPIIEAAKSRKIPVTFKDTQKEKKQIKAEVHEK